MHISSWLRFESKDHKAQKAKVHGSSKRPLTLYKTIEIKELDNYQESPISNMLCSVSAVGTEVKKFEL